MWLCIGLGVVAQLGDGRVFGRRRPDEKAFVSCWKSALALRYFIERIYGVWGISMLGGSEEVLPLKRGMTVFHISPVRTPPPPPPTMTFRISGSMAHVDLSLFVLVVNRGAFVLFLAAQEL